MKKRILSCFLALAMALSLLPMSVLAVGEDETPIQGSSVTSTNNNITVNKTVSGNQENGYTVTMEAYAENQVTSSTTTKPLDIVLVLDVSGSMGDPISYTITQSRNWTYNDINDSEYSYYCKKGDNYYKVEADTYKSWRGTTYYQLVYTDNYGYERRLGDASSRENQSLYEGQLYIGGEIRLDALKTAVSGFIDSVADNASTNKVDHKISIVKFAGNESSAVGNHTYDSDFGPYNYSQIVCNLTSVSSNADNLKNTVAALNAGGATRADYGMEYAESALESARLDSQKVVVMFTDGSPTSGSDFERDVANDAIQASKTLKDDDVIVYTIGIFEGANPDGKSNENKYMNGVSSNYPDATSYTNLGQRVSADLKYYFASDTAAGLAGVFEIISNTITSNSLTANPDAAAVLSDTLSEYFDFPADVMNDGKITVQKVPVTGKNPDGSYTWGSPVDITDEVNILTDNGKLTVKGFNYKQNAVTELDGTYSGAKLVVSFPIVPDEDACILRPLPYDYYPTNSVANGSQAGLSYKGSDDAEGNDASTLLSSSPKVYLDRTNFDANGTDVTVQVFVDGQKVDNPLTYVELTRDVQDTSYNYFQQVDNKAGVLTYDFNYNPGDGGHDCVDIQVDIIDGDTYLLQGVTSYQSHGKSGTDNVRTNTTEDPETGEKIPDGTYTVDNVTADGQEETVDCTIYLYTKYSVAYYQDSTLLEGSYSDTKVYIAGENVTSSTAEKDYPTSDTPVEMNWKNDGYSTSIALPSLPTVTGSTVDGWFLGSASSETKYDPTTASPVAVSNVKDNATVGNVIQFYATSTANEYTLSYEWTGLPEGATVTPPTGGTYQYGDSVTLDSSYTSTTTTKVDHDTYTFSGWTAEPALENGKMPASDVTVSGTWKNTGSDPQYDIIYGVTGDAPTTYSPIPTGSKEYEGETVTVAAGLTTTDTTNKDGVSGTWTFSGWSTEDVTVINNQFTMPAEDVTFTGSWSFTPDTHTITINYVDNNNEPLQLALEKTQTDNSAYSFDVSSNDTGDIPFIINKEGTQYVFDHFTTDSDALSGTLKGDVTITAVYLVDENKNNVPDVYEATVTYKVVNGTWGDGSTADKTADFILRMFNDETNSWDEQHPKLGNTIPTGMKPDTGYASEGSWDEFINATTPAVNGAIYTYTFADRVYTLTYDANGGDSDSVPTDTTAYKSGNTATLDTKTVPTHDKAGDTSVIFIGWSETKSETIFSAGEDYGDTVETVTFTNENITVYAVWGYDTNGDDIADATQVLIQPAAMTIYTGGEDGYDGIVNGEGNIVSSNNSLPEPGFYFTLPYDLEQAIKTDAGISSDEAAVLSNYLTITASTSGGESRKWTVTLYDDDPAHNSAVNGRYVYRILTTTDGQDPVRLQFTDQDGTVQISDEFDIADALYQTYTMGIYKGAVESSTVEATVTIDDSSAGSASVGLVDSTLTIRGVTGKEVTTPIAGTVSDPVETITAATGDQIPSYYINGSQILVSNQDAVQLLVDEIVNSELEDGTKVQDALLDKAKDSLPENATHEFKYLDLVDTSNGNVWVTMGKNDSLTVYWPYPEGTSKEDSFTIVHYKGLDREFDLNDLNAQDVTLEVYSTENGKLEATDQGLKFTVNSFSPFVLAYDNTEPGLSVDKSIDTVNGREYTGGRVSVGDTIGYSIVVKNTGNTTLSDITVTDTLWTAGQTITVDGSTASVNDDGSYVIETLAPDASVTITYTYKVVRSDGGKTLSNTAVANDGSGTTGEDTEDVVVKRPSGGGDVEPPELDTENHYGYIVGYDDGTVRPNGKITRAEVATIFFRLLTDESRDAYWCQTNDFSDVSASDWYNNAISTLTNAGILDGYGDGTFRPNGNITRAEFATIAVRFFDLTYEGEDLFPDISDHWARDYINQAAAAGFVNGYEDGTFRPNNAITRAEAVTLVNRTLERKPHKAHLLADMIQWPDNMDQTTWYYADIQEATNSHEYYMTTSEQGEEYEIWTEILPVRDWPALEKEWSDANSSTGADVTN